MPRLGLGAIGIGYVLAPHWVYALYGIGLDSVNEANMVRAAYGGLFVASALFFVLGATNDGLIRPALIYVLVFMLGLAFGRTTSVLVDRVPSGLIVLVQGGEVVYITLAALALYRRQN